MAKKIASNTLRLPRILCTVYNIDKTIKFLEEYNLKYLKTWQCSIWLRGSLGIIFNEHGEFILNEYKIVYNTKYGVSIEGM